MPPTVEDRLRDILESIVEIETLMKGASFRRFSTDRMLRLAIERLLEIVCEASRNLPDEVKDGGPGIDWRSMIDFGMSCGMPITPPTPRSYGYRPKSSAAVEVVRRTAHKQATLRSGPAKR